MSISPTSKNTKAQLLEAYKAILVENQALKLELKACEHKLKAESIRANQLVSDLAYVEDEAQAREEALAQLEDKASRAEATPVYTTASAVKLHDDLIASGSKYFNSGQFFIAARKDHFALIVKGAEDRTYKVEHIPQLMDWAHADV